MKPILITSLMVMAFSGVIPVLVLLAQFTLTGFNRFRSHYFKCEPYTPNVAILVPAWNEADVIEATLLMLMALDYPKDALRVYVIDDGSTDNTPSIVKTKQAEYPENIFYLRREKGGQGKCHTLNYGLDTVMSETWAEAILIIDADVLVEKASLRRMTRHLADPRVGAVTSYVQEGSSDKNLVNKFIAYEYVGAQAAARRAQNVLGTLACLAGGAQLHKRSNMEAIGGKIDVSTLAEDTFTTFQTQVLNKHVIFDGNSIVRSEEPHSVYGLWKQRFRWSRGNLQITYAFRHLWFRFWKPSGLGGIFFGLVWFSLVLMPFLMICSSIGLVALFFLDRTVSWQLFYLLFGVSAIAYVFMTLYTYLLDPRTAKRAWFAGMMFPGAISLVILIVSVIPRIFEHTVSTYLGHNWFDMFILFADMWVSLCILFAWLIYRLDRAGVSKKITNILLVLVGYGPILCAVGLAAFFAEVGKVKMHWDKTEKMGKFHFQLDHDDYPTYSFEETLVRDIAHENKLFWYELFALICTALLLLALHTPVSFLSFCIHI